MKNVKDNLVTIGQLSRGLNISAVWLKEQADKGVLPCVNAGGKLFFNYQAVKNKIGKLAIKEEKK